MRTGCREFVAQGDHEEHGDAGCLDARIDALVHVGETCQATDRDGDETGVVGECSWNVESSRSESGQRELARKTERHERNGRLGQAIQRVVEPINANNETIVIVRKA